jgi:rhombotail lipoprotein
MQGFDLAVTDMTKNLDDELARFKVRVKEEKIAKVEHSNNYSGGTIDIQFGLLLLIMLFIRLRLSKDVER